eukprot:5342218-Pyramimonas_sp.AAC.1
MNARRQKEDERGEGRRRRRRDRRRRMKIILADNPTKWSCEYRKCEYLLRLRSPRAHRTHEGCVGAFGGGPCEATKRVRGEPKWARCAHANAAAGAFGGAPCGATKR